MNVPPICEHATEDFKKWMGKEKCDLRAEWRVIDKTAGTQADYCHHHLIENLPAGHTFSVFPARSHAKEDGIGLPLGEAKAKNVCRICGEKAAPKQREDGTIEPFILGHGYEFAHEGCLTAAALERLALKLAETGPHRMD